MAIKLSLPEYRFQWVHSVWWIVGHFLLRYKRLCIRKWTSIYLTMENKLINVHSNVYTLDLHKLYWNIVVHQRFKIGTRQNLRFLQQSIKIFKIEAYLILKNYIEAHQHVSSLVSYITMKTPSCKIFLLGLLSMIFGLLIVPSIVWFTIGQFIYLDKYPT